MSLLLYNSRFTPSVLLALALLRLCVLQISEKVFQPVSSEAVPLKKVLIFTGMSQVEKAKAEQDGEEVHVEAMSFMALVRKFGARIMASVRGARLVVLPAALAYELSASVMDWHTYRSVV